MKNTLTLTRLYRPWLLLLQIAGLFTFYATAHIGLSFFTMSICSALTGLLIRVLPNKNLYFLYNSGYSFFSAYTLAAVINVILFLVVAVLLRLLSNA